MGTSARTYAMRLVHRMDTVDRLLREVSDILMITHTDGRLMQAKDASTGRQHRVRGTRPAGPRPGLQHHDHLLFPD